jgi:CHASE2 domain-containing sensor protein
MLSNTGKLVVIKLDGDFDRQGFRVNLELGLEGKRPYAEISGSLPVAPNLIFYLEQWQKQYRYLDSPSRIKPKEIIYGGGIGAIEKLLQLTYQLTEELKAWLDSESFRPIDKLLREELSRHESIRVLLRADNPQVHRLPWHLWDFLERYPQTELALGASAFKQIEPVEKVTNSPKVRILAILGNSYGINTDEDRNLLSTLADTEVVFLVEPKRQELNYLLWEKPWDILFFAGHSETKQGKGQIYLNSEDSLTIEELKYGLKRAIAQGLQLAIFNSCDGLGLAYQLEQLKLPQVIVMREPVPDRVAQEFLKNFLRSFASGDSLYSAARIARERLQGWEDRFPCASWLPVIYQHPAVIPPSWQELRGQITKAGVEAWQCYAPTPVVAVDKGWVKRIGNSICNKWQKILPKFRWSSIAGIVLVSLLITNLTVGARSLGMLQHWELRAFDRLMQNRAAEPPDGRILVVTIDESDIAYQQQQGMSIQGSLSDTALNLLLEKILPYHPRAIGLDIYRDRPFSSKLANLLAQTQQFIGVCRSDSQESKLSGIASSPNLSLTQLGFSDFPFDPDNKIRRQFLGMTPDNFCQTDRSFSLQLALLYLRDRDVKMTERGLQIASVLIRKLQGNAGGYQLNKEETQGYQIFINYRSSNPPTIPLRDLLDYNDRDRLKELVGERIIMIGVDLNNQDRFDTPYSLEKIFQRMPGVLVHAQMVSQIISAVLDRRSLLSWLPEWLEIVWIGCWSLLASILFYFGNLIFNPRHKFIYFLLVIASVLFVQYFICLLFFCNGIWLPAIAPATALILSAAAIVYNPFRITIAKK